MRGALIPTKCVGLDREKNANQSVQVPDGLCVQDYLYEMNVFTFGGLPSITHGLLERVRQL